MAVCKQFYTLQTSQILVLNSLIMLLFDYSSDTPMIRLWIYHQRRQRSLIDRVGYSHAF